MWGGFPNEQQRHGGTARVPKMSHNPVARSQPPPAAIPDRGPLGRLTARKTSHFRELHREAGVPYEEMLFFDDCNWGDHCRDVAEAYGVVTQRTPAGVALVALRATVRVTRISCRQNESLRTCLSSVCRILGGENWTHMKVAHKKRGREKWANSFKWPGSFGDSLKTKWKPPPPVSGSCVRCGSGVCQP